MKKDIQLPISEALIILDGLIGVMYQIIQKIDDKALKAHLYMNGCHYLKQVIENYSELEENKKELKNFKGFVINNSN